MPLSLQFLALLAAAIPFTFAQGSTGVTISTDIRTFTAYATTAPSTTKTIRRTNILDTITLTTTSRTVITSPIRFTTVESYTYLSALNITSTFQATTNVFTSNFTNTQYNTINNTVTSYNNVTATTGNTIQTSSLVIVPTPSGFMPVYDSSNNYNYNKTGSKRDNKVAGDNLLPRQAAPASSLGSDTSFISLISIVTRLQPLTTSTVVVTSTKTSTQRPPATVTSATTSTITNTIGVPNTPVDSTFTVTFSTTLNITRAVTIPAERTVATVTTVLTNYTTTRTTYAACATNNLLGPRLSGGSYINKVTDNIRANVGSSTNTTTSYDCCTTCQDAADCDFAYFDTLAASDKCTVFKSATGPSGNATCSHQQAGFFNVNANAVNRWVVINGPCGQLVQGNPTPAASASPAPT